MVVGPADAGERLDRTLANHLETLSRTRIKTLIEQGAVMINGESALVAKRPVADGDAITIQMPALEAADPKPQDIPLSILFEDEAVIVINKPAGLVVHPGAGNPDGTLVNALLAHCGDTLSGIGGVKRPGIVHRLDKDTSGVMVVAKTDNAHQSLTEQFADHGRTGPLERRYQALVWGAPNQTRGTINEPIGRAPNHPIKFTVRRDGKTAITHYRVIDRLSDHASHLECSLETGRTHQIRVHLTAKGHPVMADPLYATGYQTKAKTLNPEAQSALARAKRQALHAGHLAFAHPTTEDVLAFDAPLPADMADLLAALRVS